MTENEALKILKRDLEIQRENKALQDGIAAMEIAIQALKDILPYRAIGTVEECRTAYAKGYNQGTIDRAEEVTKAREHGYAKAVQEFSEALCNRAEEESIDVYFHDGLYGLVVEIENLKDMVGKIAEEMRCAE